MEPLVAILAVLGFAALARNALVAWARAVKLGVEAFATRQIARTRADHGDVTGMQEARSEASAARRLRTRAVVRGALWGTALVAPLATRWTAGLYAVAALLWLPVLAARRGKA